LLAAILAPAAQLVWYVGIASLILMSVFGALAASTGGASVVTGTWRVTFWGALAMAITAGVGRLFGVAA
jgi:VIT1/CCC1 family predicted Fe2+/Mn2+ transporter